MCADFNAGFLKDRLEPQAGGAASREHRCTLAAEFTNAFGNVDAATARVELDGRAAKFLFRHEAFGGSAFVKSGAKGKGNYFHENIFFKTKSSCLFVAAMILKLDEKNLRESSHWLANQDEALAFVLEKYGYPPLWSREPGFSTVVHIILEQQVSLASANAAFLRLKEILKKVTPSSFLSLDDATLRAIGFSRQKTAYARALAEAILSKTFDFEQLELLPDEEVRIAMKRLKGIGDWTADIYLSECLLRPDVLPKGDIAMQEAFRVLKNLEKRPAHEDFEHATRHWRPWRSVGTRMLWHFYLCERRRGGS